MSRFRSIAPWIVLAMLGLIVIPAFLTLESIRQPIPITPVDQQSSPHGYTWSLLLFIIPSAAIAGWFLPSEGLPIPRRAFLWTLGILAPLGCGLDFFFAQWFFLFPNRGATLGLEAPALGHPVPAEEYVFYLMGFLTVLLLYIWLSEYWLAAYNVPATKQHRLFHFHLVSLLIAFALIGAAWFYKKHFALPADQHGFPGYFTFLAAAALFPSAAFFPLARHHINWRALSMTVFYMLLVSLLWEATLALPYHWWGFQHRQMMGVFIGAWSGLPVEETVLWVAVSYATVIIFEVLKLWVAPELDTSRPRVKDDPEAG